MFEPYRAKRASRCLVVCDDSLDRAVFFAMVLFSSDKLRFCEATVNEKKAINELKVNTLGKIFFATLAAWLVGKVVSTKIRGSREEVEAVGNALAASKIFQDELNRSGATVDSVIQKLNIKHMSASEFERTLGVPWPL